MSGQLPPSVRMKLEELIRSSGVSHADMVAAVANVSQKYRRLTAGKNLQISSDAESYGYLATRLPATYAAVMAVLRQIGTLIPDFSPRTMLDIGAGPATATLATTQFFDTLEQCTLLEPNSFLRGVGTALLEQNVHWVNSTLQTYAPDTLYDVMVASYVLNEVDKNSLSDIVAKYWAQCRGVLVVIEPGTPQGADVIATLRGMLSTLDGARLLGPCPQDKTCPLVGSDRWCHFSARVERSKLHKTLKDADMGYEDEKFSWVAFSRFPVERTANRIIGHPVGTKVRELQVCQADGTAPTLTLAKSHPHYKATRKLEWGDGF